MRLQLAAINAAGDLSQSLAGDIDEKESGFDAQALRGLLIRARHGRNQLAASTKNLERAVLRFAADQIDDGVRVADLFVETLRAIIDCNLCAEVAYDGEIVLCRSRDDFQTRIAGQLHCVGADIACRSMYH